MKLHTVAVFGNVPVGTKLFLTQEQASARAHALTTLKAATKTSRGVYATNQQLGFKAGEEIGIDGDLDRGLEKMLGLDSKVTPTKRQTPAEKRLAAATAELEAARVALTEAQTGLAAADEAGKVAADKAARAAERALKKAESVFEKAGGSLAE